MIENHEEPVPESGTPYFSTDIFRNFAWQAGDVVVSSGVKQGTTWTLNIVHQLRTGGDDSFDSLSDQCPFLEFVEYPGQPVQERLAYWQAQIFHQQPFRVFKTHIPPPVLPMNPEVKYIVPVRNGKDSLASLYFFINNFTPEWNMLWGDQSASWQDCFNWGMEEKKYWHFINSWLPYRHAENVLLLHYDDLKRDLGGNVRRIADFLALTHSDEQWMDILEKCGFAWMKAHQAKFDDRATVTKVRVSNAGAMIRKGLTGDYQTVFTPAQEAQWDAVALQELPDPAIRAWCDHGGILPG
jgi:aryl sulfotransferase